MLLDLPDKSKQALLPGKVQRPKDYYTYICRMTKFLNVSSSTYRDSLFVLLVYTVGQKFRRLAVDLTDPSFGISFHNEIDTGIIAGYTFRYYFAMLRIRLKFQIKFHPLLLSRDYLRNTLSN